MQNTIFYVSANETLGVIRDYLNARTVTAPTLVRGIAACLKIRLFATSEGTEPYPMSTFENVVSWQWAMDNDFNESTAYKIVADDSQISVYDVTELIDEEEHHYTEVSIPISNMNTDELAKWIGTEKSKTGLAGELVGYNSSGKQIFILQIEGFTVRNRITSLGSPAELAPDYLNAAQIRALIAAGLEFEHSPDAVSWHSGQLPGDQYMHIRLKSEASSAWSDPIKLLSGPPGETGASGVSSFCYAAYAADDTGTGFSLIPDNSLKYRAELHVDHELNAAPDQSDFAGAIWVKYIGDDGLGTGDMKKEVYDPDDDGKVSLAQEADHAAVADAVSWEHVSGKPETFPFAAHTHAVTDIDRPVCQKYAQVSGTAALFLNTPIIRQNGQTSGATINFVFRGIQTRPGGTSYSMAQDEFLTWEYHVRKSVPVTGMTMGSETCAVEGINLPDTLPLIGNASTWHVFAVRVFYDSYAAGSIRYQVSYAYSYRESLT